MPVQTQMAQEIQQCIRKAQDGLMEIGQILSQLPNAQQQQLKQKCQQAEQLCAKAGQELKQAQADCEQMF